MDINQDIKKQNNFIVPKNYFDYLPEEVMDKIQAQSRKKEEKILLKPSFLLASLTLLSGFILLVIFFLKKEVGSNEIMLSDSEVQQIIDNPELYNIDDTDITEKYLFCNLSDESFNSETTVSDEDIKSYLEENTDVNNSINEL